MAAGEVCGIFFIVVGGHIMFQALFIQILAESSDFHAFFRDILHAQNLRHGTDGFTSPPKEGVLRIFCPEKSDGFGRV